MAHECAARRLGAVRLFGVNCSARNRRLDRDRLRLEPAVSHADHLGQLHTVRRALAGHHFRRNRPVASQPVAQGVPRPCRRLRAALGVVVTAGDASDSPQQVLFFDRKAPIGMPTPDPRPYITVTLTGNDVATVQYQWRQRQEPACCPTGIGTAGFTIKDDKLKALDPIPNQ